MDEASTLLRAQYALCIVTGIICIINVIFILIKVNKRIPASFFVSISLYTVAILSRAINELLGNTITSKPRIITTSICITLIELSLAYFVFEIYTFKMRLKAESPSSLHQSMVKGKRIKQIVFGILVISSVAKIYVE